MSNYIALKSFTTMNGLVLQEFSYSDDIKSLYPYRFSDNLQKAFQELAVKVPFTKIIDKSMGISTCSTCGSKYSGNHEEKCIHKGLFFRVGDYRYTNYLTLEEARKHSNYYDKVDQVWTECGGNVKWDLYSQFLDQQNFFRVIESAWEHSQPGMAFGAELGIMSFADCLPSGLAVHLENNYLKSVVSELKRTLDVHNKVLKEISDRMQSAGNNLLNGGRF